MCRYVVWLFAILYAGALALLAVGTFGLFGSERDPLAGVFLIPLGMPWNGLIDLAPEALWPWLAMAAPAVNLAILWGACRWFRRRAGHDPGR
jgi:hypothetical protein